MKRKVSEMMDGELDQQEIADIIATMKETDDLEKNWQTYHLIGDALRQSEKLSINIADRVSAQLQAEPTILAPSAKPSKSSQYNKSRIFTYSIAASLVAMVTAWLGFQYQEPQQMMVAEQQRPSIESNRSIQPVMVSTPPAMVYQQPPAEMNDYLFVHREFLPGTATNNQTINLQPVVESHRAYDNYNQYQETNRSK